MSSDQMTTGDGANRVAGRHGVNLDWLAKTREDALDPDLKIVDPHHHLWDHANHRYLIEDLLLDTNDGHNVVATVFVECAAMYRAGASKAMAPVGETEFVNGIAAMSASGQYGDTRVCAGIVGHANLLLGEAVDDVLGAHIAAGSGRFRGIRHSASWDESDQIHNGHSNAPKDLYAVPEFRAGFARLAAHGLSFEAWQYHPQLPMVADLARAFPDTTIILNHVGGPLGIGPYAGRRSEVFAVWQQSIAKIAQCPNVVVKLGGLGMKICGFDFHKQAAPPTSQQLADAWRPYIDHCISAFGPERAMFESNFPVDKASCGYGLLWNALKRLAAGASASEKAALFHDTAARVYRLET